jgi:hypothetical protein
MSQDTRSKQTECYICPTPTEQIWEMAILVAT